MFQRGSTRVLFRLALLDAGIYLLAIIVLYSTRGLTYTALVDGKLQPVHVIPSGAVTAVALAYIAIASFFGLYAYCDSMRIAIAGSFLIFYIVLSTELIFSTLAQTVDETYSQDIIDRFGEYIVWILAFYFGSSVVDKAIGTIGEARKDGEPTERGQVKIGGRKTSRAARRASSPVVGQQHLLHGGCRPSHRALYETRQIGKLEQALRRHLYNSVHMLRIDAFPVSSHIFITALQATVSTQPCPPMPAAPVALGGQPRGHLDEVQQLLARGVPLMDPADPTTTERYGL